MKGKGEQPVYHIMNKNKLKIKLKNILRSITRKKS